MYKKIIKNIPDMPLVAVCFVLLASFQLTACGGSGEEENNITPVSEGSSDNPVNITGKTPYKGSVGRNGLSFYVIEGVDVSVSYNVTLSNLKSDADLSINSFYTSRNGYLESEVIYGVGGFSRLVFRIEDNSDDYMPTYNGTTFTLSIVPDGQTININTGTQQNPQDIAGLLPYEGIAQSTGKSYYKISGLNVEQSYELRVTDQHGFTNNTLLVNGGDATGCTLNSGANGIYVCTVQAVSDGAAGGEIYFEFSAATFASLLIDLVDPAQM